MPAVKMTSSTSDLESFSKNSFIAFKFWVAAFTLAATLVLFATPSFAYAVYVEGLSPWQKSIAEKAIGSVAEKMDSSAKAPSLKVLSAVSGKLFTGYKVENISVSSGDIFIELSCCVPLPAWEVEIEYPKLQGYPSKWFESDASGIDAIIRDLICDMPVEALAWCDVALRNEIYELLAKRIPGWTPSFIVRSDSEKTVFKVSFSPDMPFVVAVKPVFSSSSLPTILYGELKDDIMEEFSEFIGIPVIWAQSHAKDINKWVEKFLNDRNIIEKTKASAKADFSAAPVSKMDVALESKHYAVFAWASVYAGTKDRTAELGLHLGRIVQIFPRWDMELYGEGITELQNWATEGRVGLRWSPWGDVWLGGEWSSKDDMFWTRLNIDPRLRKPYLWLRLREDGELNTGLGWKATEYISLELHYDSRDSDKWSLRMLGNL